MKTIMQHMLEHGYASSTDFPELHDEKVRASLHGEAERVGLLFHYDLATRTASVVLEADEETYSPLEQATLLVCWQYTAYRESLRNGRGRDLDFAITPDRLAKEFPNLYPNPGQATKQLNLLRDRGILLDTGAGYLATPLLRHVVDEASAAALIDGELAGDFEHLKPRQGTDLEAQILHALESIAPTPAGKKVLQKRLKSPYSEIKPVLDMLVERGDVKVHGAGRGTRYSLEANHA